MTVMGDALMDEFSDRGSIPLRSICDPYLDSGAVTCCTGKPVN